MYELLPLNINFYVKRWAKYPILFNKFQFIDEIAIKKRKPAVEYKSSRLVRQFQ